MSPGRGCVCWARLDKRRPVLVLQNTMLLEAGAPVVHVVPLTTNLALADLPGQVRLPKRKGLRHASVANLYDVQVVHRRELIETICELSSSEIEEIEAGLRFVWGL